MELNQNILKGKWSEIKGEVQKAWGKITDDELEQTKGDLKAIQGLVQQKYGRGQEDFNRKLSDIVNRIDQRRDDAFESVKNNLRS